jgi:hypothetical protein
LVVVGEAGALWELVEADLPGIGNALVDCGESPPVIEIRGVDGVSGGAELVRKRTESGL